MAVKVRRFYLIDLSLTRESIGRLRSVTGLPILLEGILSVEDAQRAVQAAYGARARSMAALVVPLMGRTEAG